MATTPVQNLPALGDLLDGDTLVGEKTPGTTGLITINGILYDEDFNDSQGIMTTTAPGVYANRTITGTSNRISISNGAGTAGNPTIDISNSYEGQITITTLGTVTTGTWQGSVVAMQYGGTSKNLTPSNGGIVYTDADSMEVLAGTATANQMLQSSANSAPKWSTATYPTTTTANGILFSSAANTITQITTANNGVVTTNGTGVPSVTTDLHTGVTIGGQYSYRVAGTDVSLADGGTGASLTAPVADRLYFYDQSAGVTDWLQLASSLTITGTTLSVNFSSGTWTGTAVGTAYGGTGQTTYTNGQLLIGNSTGNTLTKATLTAGVGVAVTNGAGSISIQHSSNTFFSVNASASQTGIVSGVYTKLLFNTEVEDEDNTFASSRHTPASAGKYLYSCTSAITAATVGSSWVVAIYKNNVNIGQNFVVAGVAGNYTVTCSFPVKMNGAGDYVEFFVYQNTGTNKDTTAGAQFNFASGLRIG